jgi:hypothetical protein
VLSDAPFRWDGLSHPTGLINWSKDRSLLGFIF